VLVTGIQQRRVCGAGSVLSAQGLGLAGFLRRDVQQHTCGGRFSEELDGYLRPAFEKVKSIRNQEDRIRALESIGITTSLANLLEYPFVKESIASGRLNVHGLWYSISDGKLLTYSSRRRQFLEVE
jgi:carbonic anhydrase